jgi:hypothetical protein
MCLSILLHFPFNTTGVDALKYNIILIEKHTHVKNRH